MIDSIDFANMYKQHKIASTFKGKKASDWDEKAESMSKRVIDSPYTAEFISKMNIEGCESLLDVGCGPGTIALALAPKMKKVRGLDFSTGMLECFLKNAADREISCAKSIHRSWEDDWSDIEPCDIVVASRSIEVKDLKDGLTKLNYKAKKAVYVTYKAGGSFVDEDILGYIGKDIVTRPDYMYVLLILREMGIYAKLDFIDTPGGSVSYESKDLFLSSLGWSVGGLDDEQKAKADEFYDKYISTGIFKPKGFKWAFIYWEK
jgi:SAM-dependent methyltransferase